MGEPINWTMGFCENFDLIGGESHAERSRTRGEGDDKGDALHDQTQTVLSRNHVPLYPLSPSCEKD